MQGIYIQKMTSVKNIFINFFTLGYLLLNLFYLFVTCLLIETQNQVNNFKTSSEYRVIIKSNVICEWTKLPCPSQNWVFVPGLFISCFVCHCYAISEREPSRKSRCKVDMRSRLQIPPESVSLLEQSGLSSMSNRPAFKASSINLSGGGGGARAAPCFPCDD